MPKDSPSLMPLVSTVGKEPAWSLGRGPGPRDADHDNTFLPTPAGAWAQPQPLGKPQTQWCSQREGIKTPREALPARTEDSPSSQDRFPKPVPKEWAGDNVSYLAKAPLGEHRSNNCWVGL